MSKIGRKAIIIPEAVTVTLAEGKIVLRGPQGALTVNLPADLGAHLEGKQLYLRPLKNYDRALWGFYHRSLSNALAGVKRGFERTLELVGVGYRAKKENEALLLQVGFSHPVRVTPPPGVALTVEEETKIKVAGLDKQKVGEVAAKIRSLRPPEPYKGKGIRYGGEVIRRKAGKAGKAGGSG